MTMVNDTEEYLLSKYGEPDIKLTPGKAYEEQRPSDDIAMEYWLYFDEKAAGGCILYGKYDRGWVCNPSARWVMRELGKHYLQAVSDYSLLHC